MKNIDENIRDYGFDNIKVFMIVLMLFAHCLEEFSTVGILGIFRAIIYSFHMPLFIFISGYFSKKDAEAGKLLENTIIPFLVFNTIWCWYLNNFDYHINVFKPVYIFWYLLSLFFWRISIKYFAQIKGFFLIAMAIGLYCGLIIEADRFFSISRTISFFPYFVLGYQFTPERVKKYRNVNKCIAWLLLALMVIVTIWMNVIGFMPVKMYEFIQAYQLTGVSNKMGILLRGLIYFGAFVYIFIFINLIPNTKNRISVMGTRTLPIYILSPFIMQPLMIIVKKVQFINDNNLFKIISSLIITFIIFVVLGNSYINKWYKAFFAKITKLVVRKSVLK